MAALNFPYEGQTINGVTVAPGYTHEAANGLTYRWDGVKWISVGSYTSGNIDAQILNSLTFDGNETEFSLTTGSSNTVVKPHNEQSVLISLNNVVKQPVTDYTIQPQAGTITFATAPAQNTPFWGVVYTRIPFDSTTNLPKAGGQMTGNITFSGAQTVDGRDLSVDGAKLDGIDTGAKDDQTGSEIKTLYEGESNTNAYTDDEKTKLAGIAAGAEVNVQSDWNVGSGDGQILNKPTIIELIHDTTLSSNSSTKAPSQASVKAYVDNSGSGTVTSVTGSTPISSTGGNTPEISISAATTSAAGSMSASDKTKLDGIASNAEVNVQSDWNSTSGDSQILNKPTIPAAQVNSDWNATSGVAQISNKPTIPSNITDLGDVTTSNPSSGQFLKWDGSAWINATGSQSGLGDIVEDTTPQLGGNLDVNGKDITSTSNGDIEFDPDGTGKVIIKGNSTVAGELKLNCENNDHGVVLRGPGHAAAADYTLTLPVNDGAYGERLTTDGSGNLSWQASGGSSGSNVINTNPASIVSNFVLTSGQNGHSVGPVSIASNIYVTVPENSTWLVS